MTALAATVGVVIVLAVAVASMTAAISTTIRRPPASVLHIMPMSESRTHMSESRTTKVLSSLSAARGAQRRALTTLLSTSHGSTASPHRDTRPAARARSPCSVRSEPGTEPAKNQSRPLRQSQRPATDQPNRRQDSTGRGTSPWP